LLPSTGIQIQNGDELGPVRGFMVMLKPQKICATDINEREKHQSWHNYLQYLINIIQTNCCDEAERMKFILASYNAGLAILDARKKASKYGKRPQL
jgi:membrane-bound lytic murein transglycosylase MltF